MKSLPIPYSSSHAISLSYSHHPPTTHSRFRKDVIEADTISAGQREADSKGISASVSSSNSVISSTTCLSSTAVVCSSTASSATPSTFVSSTPASSAVMSSSAASSSSILANSSYDSISLSSFDSSRMAPSISSAASTPFNAKKQLFNQVDHDLNQQCLKKPGSSASSSSSQRSSHSYSRSNASSLLVQKQHSVPPQSLPPQSLAQDSSQSSKPPPKTSGSTQSQQMNIKFRKPPLTLHFQSKPPPSQNPPQSLPFPSQQPQSIPSPSQPSPSQPSTNYIGVNSSEAAEAALNSLRPYRQVSISRCQPIKLNRLSSLKTHATASGESSTDPEPNEREGFKQYKDGNNGESNNSSGNNDSNNSSGGRFKVEYVSKVSVSSTPSPVVMDTLNGFVTNTRIINHGQNREQQQQNHDHSSSSNFDGEGKSTFSSAIDIVNRGKEEVADNHHHLRKEQSKEWSSSDHTERAMINSSSIDPIDRESMKSPPLPSPPPPPCLNVFAAYYHGLPPGQRVSVPLRTGSRVEDICRNVVKHFNKMVILKGSGTPVYIDEEFDDFYLIGQLGNDVEVDLASSRPIHDILGELKEIKNFVVKRRGEGTTPS